MIQESSLRRDLEPNYNLLAIWTVLNIIDAVSTYAALQGNGIELNPVINLAINNFQLLPALILKVLLSSLIGMFILLWNRKLFLVLNIPMAGIAALTTIAAFLS